MSTGTAADVFACFPAIRTVALMTYGFAAFAKLNHGFFAVASSCNSAFISYNLAALLPDCVWAAVPPSALRFFLRLMLVVVVAVETLVPLSLMAGHRWSIVFVSLFHIGLGTIAFDFSSTMFASLPLWSISSLHPLLSTLMLRGAMKFGTVAAVLVAVCTTNCGQLASFKLIP